MYALCVYGSNDSPNAPSSQDRNDRVFPFAQMNLVISADVNYVGKGHTMKLVRAAVPIILILQVLALPACTHEPESTATSIIASTENFPTEGWPESTPEEQGMDSEMLTGMLDELIERSHNIDSITVIRHGYMVLDLAVYPYRSSRTHVIHSCTKSIVSALIGIALEQGYLESVDQPLLDIFADREVANLDADKRSITLEHLLTMSSGLECRDSYLYRWDGLEEMINSEDWVQHMLDLPMAEPPGTRFEYCNGGSFLLSAIIQETTGMTAEAFAEKYLFGPLGISEYYWPSNPQGISIGWGNLRMLPHDMAKIGYLYLQNGIWGGEQILPAEWVSASTSKHISATLQDGYGYQWWIDSPDVYMALGYAGQFIFVVPDLDLVVVFTSDLSEAEFYTPQRLLDTYILPSAEYSESLPENPLASEELKTKIEILQSGGNE